MVPETTIPELVAKYEGDHPDLAEAMKLAAEAQEAWKAYEAGSQPAIEYSTDSGTRNAA